MANLTSKYNTYEKILHESTSVNRTLNPFSKTIETLTSGQLIKFVLQYCIFPKNIISILHTATYNLSYNNFTAATNELIQNINEELGVYTDETCLIIPKPHYTVLRTGIMEGLGIDINYQQADNSTEQFISKLKSLVDASNIHKVCGSVYAIEYSAILELEIVLSLVKQLFKLEEKEPPSFLVEFFQYHVDDIEVGHKDRFYNYCSEHLKKQQHHDDFEMGFREVMQSMDTWWLTMYSDIVETHA